MSDFVGKFRFFQISSDLSGSVWKVSSMSSLQCLSELVRNILDSFAVGARLRTRVIFYCLVADIQLLRAVNPVWRITRER